MNTLVIFYGWFFKEPRVNCFDILPPRRFVSDVTKEDKKKIHELCKVWDQQGFLTFCPADLFPQDLRLASRVFNNYKNRGKCRSKLPRGCATWTKPTTSCRPLPPSAQPYIRFQGNLVGAITDRRDYYHQFHVSFEKASTNFLFPFLRADEVTEFGAHHGLVGGWGQKKKSKKIMEAERDFPGVDRPSLLLSDDICFASLFQGDNLGVEIATVAHAGMLEAYKLLKSPSRLQSGVCLQDDLCVESLYIDDYFAISREDAWLVGEPSFRARSSEAFYRAKEAYTSEEVFGYSKSDCFRVLGAEIDSRQFLVEGGLVSCGLPAEKRLALAMVASMSAWLPVTSDGLHSSLVGSIISMLLFRSPPCDPVL